MALALAVGLSGPRVGRAASPPLEPRWVARVGASAALQTSPPFFPTPRDRLALEAELCWRPAPQGWVSARMQALRWDLYGEDHQELGAGDLELATGIVLGTGAWRGELQTGVKLPNADDERQLGSDETDVLLLGGLLSRPGPLALDLHAGVDVRGDPHRSASQDPVVLLRLSAGSDLGTVTARARIWGELPTDRQPGRALFGLGLEGRCPVLVGGEAFAGATSAGPDLGGRAWLGLGAGCAGPDPAAPPR